MLEVAELQDAFELGLRKTEIFKGPKCVRHLNPIDFHGIWVPNSLRLH